MTHVVIDCSNLAYQALHTLGELSHNEVATGVLFNMLTRVLILGGRYKTNSFIFAFDSPTTTGVRRKAYPPYKANRRKDEDPEDAKKRMALLRQLDTLRDDILPSLGFSNTFYMEGFEADDIIAAVVGVDNQSTAGQGLAVCAGCAKDDQFIIVSGDHDLYQVLGRHRRTILYSCSTQKEYTAEDFLTEWKIEPYQWPVVKSIAGCSADNIEGVVGVGEITACKYIRGELKEESKKCQALREFKHRGRNSMLVALPHKEFPREVVQVTPNEYRGKATAFREMCAEYGFRSFTEGSMFEQWKSFFKGDFSAVMNQSFSKGHGRVRDVKRSKEEPGFFG